MVLGANSGAMNEREIVRTPLYVCGQQLTADSCFFCALLTSSLSSLGRGDIPNHSLEPTVLHDLLYCDHGRFLQFVSRGHVK